MKILQWTMLCVLGLITPAQACTVEIAATCQALPRPSAPSPGSLIPVQYSRPGEVARPKDSPKGDGALAKVGISQGIQQVFTKESRIAPFKVKTPLGSSHYFLKLVKASDKAPVLTFYIRGGQTFELKVPLGTYRLKYASGETWYGLKHYFGEHTAYSEAEADLHFSRAGNVLKGHSVELIKQVGGNLQTKPIKPADF